MSEWPAELRCQQPHLVPTPTPHSHIPAGHSGDSQADVPFLLIVANHMSLLEDTVMKEIERRVEAVSL